MEPSYKTNEFLQVYSIEILGRFPHKGNHPWFQFGLGPVIGSSNGHGEHPCPWIRVSDPQTATKYFHVLGSEYRIRTRVWSTFTPLDPGIGPSHGHEVHSCPWIRVSNPQTGTECIYALGSGYRVHTRARSPSMPLDPGIGPSHEH